MIVVRIILNVLPEKHLEFTQTLLSLIEPTRKETGCLSYSLSCDVEDKNCFNLLEEWGSRKDLDDHIGSHRFGVLLGSKSLLRKPLEISIYTISAADGMEVVNSMRKNQTNFTL